MHHAEFQIGGFLDVRLGFGGGGFGKAGELDADAVVAFRLNHRFGHAETVHAFAQDFDGLLERGGGAVGTGDFVRVQLDAVGVHLDEERRAAREVNAALDASGGFALELVQDERGRMRFGLGFKEREVGREVVRVDGCEQAGVGAVRPGFLQRHGVGED